MDLGKSLIIKDQLSGSEELTLYGRMEGSLALPDHTLAIGPHADILARISAKAVVILGAVTGHLTPAEKVKIRDTSSVADDIASPWPAIAD